MHVMIQKGNQYVTRDSPEGHFRLGTYATGYVYNDLAQARWIRDHLRKQFGDMLIVDWKTREPILFQEGFDDAVPFNVAIRDAKQALARFRFMHHDVTEYREAIACLREKTEVFVELMEARMRVIEKEKP